MELTHDDVRIQAHPTTLASEVDVDADGAAIVQAPQDGLHRVGAKVVGVVWFTAVFSLVALLVVALFSELSALFGG